MWIGYILNKTQHDELSSKCPFSRPKITLRFKVHSQSSSSADWIEHLSSSPCVSLLSAYIHSSSVSKCKLSISPVCAFPSSAPSAVQVCERRVPGLQRAHRPIYFRSMCTGNSHHSDWEPQWCFVYLAGETGVTVPLRSMWVNTVNTVWGQIVPNNPPSARLNTNVDPNNNVVGYPLAGNRLSIDFVQKYK